MWQTITDCLACSRLGEGHIQVWWQAPSPVEPLGGPEVQPLEHAFLLLTQVLMLQTEQVLCAQFLKEEMNKLGSYALVSMS